MTSRIWFTRSRSKSLHNLSGVDYEVGHETYRPDDQVAVLEGFSKPPEAPEYLMDDEDLCKLLVGLCERSRRRLAKLRCISTKVKC
jgi:hypothetical protein